MTTEANLAPSPQDAPASDQIAADQIAALCWRLHKGHVEVLLVTSRETRRWVLPKGWPMEGLTPEAAAACEAWEEAGVKGKISTVSIGSYSYDKILPKADPLACAVAVYPLRVQSVQNKFPERKERRRKWFSAYDASLLVAEADLRDLLEHVSQEPDCLACDSSATKALAGKTLTAKTRASGAGSKRAKAAKP
ncbi:MAG: NUDIX hydrolase [Cypionkella sp.]